MEESLANVNLLGNDFRCNVGFVVYQASPQVMLKDASCQKETKGPRESLVKEPEGCSLHPVGQNRVAIEAVIRARSITDVKCVPDWVEGASKI